LCGKNSGAYFNGLTASAGATTTENEVLARSKHEIGLCFLVGGSGSTKGPNAASTYIISRREQEQALA
jgi:hypothetical protein